MKMRSQFTAVITFLYCRQDLEAECNSGVDKKIAITHTETLKRRITGEGQMSKLHVATKICHNHRDTTLEWAPFLLLFATIIGITTTTALRLIRLLDAL